MAFSAKILIAKTCSVGMQLGQVECAVLDDPRFCQSSILLKSFSGQIVRLLVEGFLVDLLLFLVFAVVTVVWRTIVKNTMA